MLCLAMTISLTKLSAQDKSKGSLEATVNRLTQAMLKPDKAVLDKLAADRLSYGHSSGKIETKAEFVETLVSGASVFEEINIQDQTIDILDNTGIVRHQLMAKTNDPGKGPGTIRLGIMLTWVKSKGEWRLLARQAYRLP